MNYTETDLQTYEALLKVKPPIFKSYHLDTWPRLGAIHAAIRSIFEVDGSPLPQKIELFNESAKTEKSLKLGYQTAVVYLHPHTSSGEPETNLCKHSTKECRGSCLAESGRLRMKASVEARTWKTRLYVRSPTLYRLLAVYEANRRRASAAAEGLKFGVRLDGTSDTGEMSNLYDVFKALDIKGWEYTKDFKRAWKEPYIYTYSHSGTQKSENDAHKLLLGECNVSVVFRVARGEPLPTQWHDFRVIDGDEHDLRFLDPAGVVVGLRLKGTHDSKAKAGKFAQRVNT